MGEAMNRPAMTARIYDRAGNCLDPGCNGSVDVPCEHDPNYAPKFKAGDRADLRLNRLAESNSGSIVTVVRQLPPDEADAEVGPMYEVRLHVFEDELSELEP